jgi:hypothetical protein
LVLFSKASIVDPVVACVKLDPNPLVPSGMFAVMTLRDSGSAGAGRE